MLLNEPGERLEAVCAITFDDAFVVRDLKVIGGPAGPFVAMPSRKRTTRCMRCGNKNPLRAAFCNRCGARQNGIATSKGEEGRAKLYDDVAHPINSVCRRMIEQRVLQAFEAEQSRARLPGYVPRCDLVSEDAGAAACTPALPR
jgi:stage V sporulation protein G